MRKLKGSDGPELHIWGSSELLQSLIAADLVDEYRFWIAPVVLGKGKRLFERDVPVGALSLISTRKTTTGVLLNVYKPAAPFRMRDSRECEARGAARALPAYHV